MPQRRSTYSSPRVPVGMPSISRVTAPVAPAAPVAPLVTQSPSLFSSIKQGFGFGIGNSIAMNIFRKDPPPATGVAAPPLETPVKIPLQNREYLQCLDNNDDNKELCKHLLDS